MGLSENYDVDGENVVISETVKKLTRKEQNDLQSGRYKDFKNKFTLTNIEGDEYVFSKNKN